MKRVFKLGVIVLTAMVTGCGQQYQWPAHTTLFLKGRLVSVEVAQSAADQKRGLMNRQHLDTDSGIWFVLHSPSRVCMWMENTSIPLSVAFIDRNGKILQIEEMTPMTKTQHCAKTPAMYALELNGNRFKELAIDPGDQIEGGPWHLSSK